MWEWVGKNIGQFGGDFRIPTVKPFQAISACFVTFQATVGHVRSFSANFAHLELFWSHFQPVWITNLVVLTA